LSSPRREPREPGRLSGIPAGRSAGVTRADGPDVLRRSTRSSWACRGSEKWTVPQSTTFKKLQPARHLEHRVVDQPPETLRSGQMFCPVPQQRRGRQGVDDTATRFVLSCRGKPEGRWSGRAGRGPGRGA
jgi:hypothetical protein